LSDFAPQKRISHLQIVAVDRTVGAATLWLCGRHRSRGRRAALGDLSDHPVAGHFHLFYPAIVLITTIVGRWPGVPVAVSGTA
jgi:hypothetical protein